jgi:hypothetical protein
MKHFKFIYCIYLWYFIQINMATLNRYVRLLVHICLHVDTMVMQVFQAHMRITGCLCVMNISRPTR